MDPRLPSYGTVVGYSPVRARERPRGCQRCCCACAAVGFVLSLLFFGLALVLCVVACEAFGGDIVATSETALYANLILKKGVVKP